MTEEQNTQWYSADTQTKAKKEEKLVPDVQ